MRLKDLIDTNLDMDIDYITSDSRDCRNNTIFVCINGHKFIKEAVYNGASFVISDEELDFDYPSLVVRNPREVLIKLLNIMYPLRKIKLIGVTGTDGKTTTCLITKYLLEDKYNVGYIGTNGIHFNNKEYPTRNTTPSVEILYRTLFTMQQSGVDFVLMEVSSHALDQNRIEGLVFDISLFTNISPEHQDYHRNINEYADTKAILMQRTKGNCIINLDDIYSYKMCNKSKKYIGYSIKNMSEYVAHNILISTVKTTFRIGGMQYETNLFGLFNVYNCLAAIICARELGVKTPRILERLTTVPQIQGRQHFFKMDDRYFLVDFAHTPNALSSLLSSARYISEGRIILVMGACGDRDRIKRPVMVRNSLKYVDMVILTDEDPKTESNRQILNDLSKDFEHEVLIIENRKKAIKFAYSVSNESDLIIVVGKGAENYQDYGSYKIVHNDIETLLQLNME